MDIWIKTNAEGYVIDFCDVFQNDDSILVSVNDFNDFFTFWNYYKLVDGELIRDTEAIDAEANRKKILEQIAALKEQLASSNDAVMEGIEALFTATTITNFLSLLAQSASRLKQTLQERSYLRQQIQELSKQIAAGG